MEDWAAEEEQWDSFPAHSTPTMVHAAHPVTTEVPPGYDGTTNWFRYADAVEEWCDLTKDEAKRRGPAVAARLSGRAEIYKERLDLSAAISAAYGWRSVGVKLAYLSFDTRRINA